MTGLDNNILMELQKLLTAMEQIHTWQSELLSRASGLVSASSAVRGKSAGKGKSPDRSRRPASVKRRTKKEN